MVALGLHCCARAFSSCRERGYSSLRCVGFSLWWLLLLQSTGSRHTGFSSCGMWAQQWWLVGSRAQAQQLQRMGLVAPWHMGSSRTRARTRVPCIGRQILNHCATREAPECVFIASVQNRGVGSSGVRFHRCSLFMQRKSLLPLAYHTPELGHKLWVFSLLVLPIFSPCKQPLGLAVLYHDCNNGQRQCFSNFNMPKITWGRGGQGAVFKTPILIQQVWVGPKTLHC